MATVGMREVAALAGVSHGSVSHYLNHPDRVSPELAARIQQAIDTLGFVPNIVGRQLRTGSSSAIAYIAPDVSNPYFATIAEGVEQRAAEAGLSVFIANSNRSRAREDAYLELFQQHRVRGMLVASHEGVEDRLAVIRRRGTPTVLVGQAAVSPEQASVSVDDVAGGALAARHLLDGGRRRLAFVGGPVGIRQVGDRLGGAQRAVDAVPGALLEVLPVEDRTIAGGVEAARALVARAPEDRPDALFAANDLLALGLLQGLVSAGVRVPEEVALVGYDDIEFAAAALIPITSIRSPHEEFGAAAVDLLVAAFDDPEAGGRRVYAPELVVRASSAAVG